MYISKPIGTLSVGDVFKFSVHDLPYKLLSVQELSDDIIVIDCKATINFYKHDRYKRFTGKVYKSLKVYIEDRH